MRISVQYFPSSHFDSDTFPQNIRRHKYEIFQYAHHFRCTNLNLKIVNEKKTGTKSRRTDAKCEFFTNTRPLYNWHNLCTFPRLIGNKSVILNGSHFQLPHRIDSQRYFDGTEITVAVVDATINLLFATRYCRRLLKSVCRRTGPWKIVVK